MMMRLFFVITVLLMVGSLAHAGADAQPGAPFKVVIDPGHGGKDTGCIGRITNEKTIVLDVAKRLDEIIAKEHPEVQTIFTRSDDRFVELNERTAIANRAAADLFISIHVNSVDKRTRGRENIHGASVYTLGMHRADDNLEVAMRENSVIELENDFSANYQGFDPSSSESYIIFELAQNMHMRRSIDFADAIQRRLTAQAGRADKGVRQSGFLVLRATSMPAVLIELDFICNPAAENFLASENGRQSCAQAIADAFSEYLSSNASDTILATTVSTEAEDVSTDDSASDVYYTIQILSNDKPLAQNDPLYGKIADIRYYRHEGRCNYITGRFDTLKQAKRHLIGVRNTFSDAFIVKMKGNSRIISNSSQK